MKGIHIRDYEKSIIYRMFKLGLIQENIIGFMVHIKIMGFQVVIVQKNNQILYLFVARK